MLKILEILKKRKEFDKMYNCLKSMINYTRWRLKNDTYYNGRIESSTVKFFLPRNSGHTRIIKKLMKEVPNSIVIVPSRQMKKLYNCRVISITELDSLIGKNNSYDLIFIDCANFIQHEQVYNYFFDLKTIFVFVS